MFDAVKQPDANHTVAQQTTHTPPMAYAPPPPAGGGAAPPPPPFAPSPPTADAAAPPPSQPPAPTANPTRVQEVRAQVESVRQVMAANVSAVLDRGERLDALEGKADDLGSTAAAFQRQGQALRRRMWLNSVKSKLFAGLAVGLVLLAVFSVACFLGGRNCLGGGSDAVVTPAPGSAAAGGGGGGGPMLGGGVVGAPGSARAAGATLLPDGTLIAAPVPTGVVGPTSGVGAPAAAADAPPPPPGTLTPDEAATALSAAGR